MRDNRESSAPHRADSERGPPQANRSRPSLRESEERGERSCSRITRARPRPWRLGSRGAPFWKKRLTNALPLRPRAWKVLRRGRSGPLSSFCCLDGAGRYAAYPTDRAFVRALSWAIVDHHGSKHQPSIRRRRQLHNRPLTLRERHLESRTGRRPHDAASSSARPMRLAPCALGSPPLEQLNARAASVFEA